MKPALKILILGIGQSNFLDQLYGGVRSLSENFSFTLANYRDITSTSSGFNKDIYERNLQLGTYKPGFFVLCWAMLSFSFTAFFWQIFHIERSQQKSVRQILTELRRYAVARYVVSRILLPQGFDVYHFHFCTPENLVYMQFLPPSARTICSFWGSDLMRMTGAANVFYVSRALHRASAITIQTQELAQMIYSKYGQSLRGKVDTLLFTAHPGLYDKMDKWTHEDAKIEFCARYRLNPSHRIAVIGHNGFEGNNHLRVIEVLDRLPARILNETTFVLPIGYGGNPAYIAKIEAEVARKTQVQFLLLRDFLNPDDTAIFRKAADVYVHVLISDALSGTLTEFLYAGTPAIAGAWLPYKILSAHGVVFPEIQNFDELPGKLTQIIESDGPRDSENAPKLRSFLLPDKTNPAWTALFNKVANGK